MKEFFKPWNPTDNSISLLNSAKDIIDEYGANDYTLTLRQLYYQFVARDIIENTDRSYKNLGTLITKARVSGRICWNSIEDRSRSFKEEYVNDDPLKLVEDLPHYIACDYWEPQDYYIEVWVEKEALGNVVERACDPLKTPFLSCKGYLSASEAYDAGKRFEKALCKGKKCKLIHLGDHDSSGIDMTRDNEERVNMFANSRSIDIERIALNHDQILEFSPPPNPAKVKDPRAKRYIKEYGTTSYELDALEPSVIESLITESIKPLIDLDLWNETKEEENDMKESLKSLRQYI